MTRTWLDTEPGWYVECQCEDALLGPYTSEAKAHHKRVVYRPFSGVVIHVPEPTDIEVLQKANGL